MRINTFSIAGLLLCFTCFALAWVNFYFGKKHIHKIWSLFNIAVGLWGFGAFFIGISTTPEKALISWKIAHIGGIFIPVFFYHTTCVFAGLKRKKVIIFAYSQGVLFLILNWTDLFITKARFVFNSLYYTECNNLFYLTFFVIWIGLVIIGHVDLVKLYVKSHGIKRHQVQYFFFGMLTGFSGGITNFFPMFKFDIYPYGNFTIPIYCLIVTYAIIRYRLMDITVAITRTGVFIAVYSLVLGAPFLIAYTLQPYLIGFLSDNWWLAPMGVLTILATVGPFIYIYINRRAENRLLRDQRRYQDTLRRASSGMIRIRDLKKLLNLIVHIITRTVKIEFAAIFLLDSENAHYKMAARRDSANLPQSFSLEVKSPLIEQLHLRKEAIVYEEVQLEAQDSPRNSEVADLEEQLRGIRAAVVVPSFVGNNLLGFLVLGKKISGKLYSQDDLNVFSVLANQAALAVENAQFYEDIKETQEQLFQAEKMATIGTMADGLSHQINNRFQALSLIAGDSLDSLQATDISKCSPELKESLEHLKYALQRIQTNVMQGGEVVKGLLKYSRPGDRGFEFIDFNRVIDGALEMVQYKVRLQELDIEKRIPKGLPKIKCNLTQLQEVFFNLIDNAYDAIKERREVLKEEGYKGKIVISAAQKDDHILITFQDNGIGIKDKDKGKLFTPFFTTKASSRKGTGLGLYVIRKIVSFHNGTVSIDSTYNKGTKFEIVLPLVKS